MDDTIISKLYCEKGMRILAALHNPQIENYAHNLADPADTTKANATKIISLFKDHSLVTEAGTDGRKKLLELTDKGESLAKAAELYTRNIDRYYSTDDDSRQPGSNRGGGLARSYST